MSKIVCIMKLGFSNDGFEFMVMNFILIWGLMIMAKEVIVISSSGMTNGLVRGQ